MSLEKIKKQYKEVQNDLLALEQEKIGKLYLKVSKSKEEILNCWKEHRIPSHEINILKKLEIGDMIKYKHHDDVYGIVSNFVCYRRRVALKYFEGIAVCFYGNKECNICIQISEVEKFLIKQ